jgi:uncharacterized alpha-E superfamily protein
VAALCAWFQLAELPEQEVEHDLEQHLEQSQEQQTQTQRQYQDQQQGQEEGGGATSATPVPLPGQALPAAPPNDRTVDGDGDGELAAADAQLEAALLLAVVSPDVPGLARQQQQLYNTASQLRERLSVDNWRALNRMVERVGPTDQAPSQAEAMTILDNAAASLMTLAGFGLDGMTRDLGWRFLSLGRRLERLQFQSMVLRHAMKMPQDGGIDWVLELSDSIVTYRARYRAQPEWLPVLDLLVLDESNPRSIMFQLDGVLKNLDTITRSYGDAGLTELQPLREALLALAPERDFRGGSAVLVDLLTRIQAASEDLSEHIGLKFFSYTGHGRTPDQQLDLQLDPQLHRDRERGA